MIAERKISSRGAKDLIMHTIEEKKDPEMIANERGLVMQSGGDNLEKVIGDIIAKNQDVVADYKGGKEAALQFLIGEGMKELKGAVDPEQLKKQLLRKIQ